MSINPHTIVSLVLCVLPLGACDGSSQDVERVISALTGKVDQQSQDLAATRVHTDAEIAELRKTYSALALGIANKATQPVTEAVVVVAETQVPEPVIEPPKPVIEPKELQWGDTGYVCVPAFRSLSCGDDGKPHHLDSNLNWID